MTPKQRPWHRLFGLSLVDLFYETPIEVELEKDLSLRQQLLDVVILRKDPTTPALELPDGFGNLAAHNLVTFKSFHEAMDGWAINELIGHYVNYRKQAGSSMQNLLPETDFRLFAVATRFPHNLARQAIVTPVGPGVYEMNHFTGPIRVIVIRELPETPNNALMHLFSARADRVQYGDRHYRVRSPDMSTLILELFQRYALEADPMPNLLQQYAREKIAEILGRISYEERLKGIPLEERLKGMSPTELLAALPPEARAALTRHLQGDGSSNTPETK